MMAVLSKEVPDAQTPEMHSKIARIQHQGTMISERLHIHRDSTRDQPSSERQSGANTKYRKHRDKFQD